jgi:hypothetical protein
MMPPVGNKTHWRQLLSLTLTKEGKAMSRKTVTIMCCVVFIASVLLVPEVSCAKATKTPISGFMIPMGSGGPDKEWVKGDNMHLRGITEMGEITGDVEGTYSVVGNYHLNLLTGEGQSFGKGIVFLTWNDGLTGTFEGTYVGKVSDSGESLTMWVVTQGTSGDAEGLKLIGTVTGSSPGPYEIEGFMIDPHGE